MGAIVYGATHGEYSDYMIAALFESEEKAKEWIRVRTLKRPCLNCKGTGEWGPVSDKKMIECWVCHGRGITKGDGNDYSIEKFPWNPTGTESEEEGR